MEQAKAIAAEAGDLPLLPHVASRVIELVSDGNTSATDLDKLIARDQALTARVLKIANSALFGRRATISTISRAVVMLGFKTVQSLIIAASTEALFRPNSVNFKDKLLWEHAVAAALAAGILARECRYPGVEEAFLGGLLHDIGKVVLDTNLGGRYQRVVERVYNEGVTFVDAERDMLGFDHAEIGAFVIKKWNLPPTLEEAVRLHHHSRGASLDPTLCAIVGLANSLCVKIGIGPERRPELDLGQLETSTRLKLTSERLELIGKNVADRLAQEKALFNLT
jgi:putative nucleotidyltransferase with HDIG domain